jgi:hypothetical protein
MRYIIWHKLIYLVLIIGSLMSVLVQVAVAESTSLFLVFLLVISIIKHSIFLFVNTLLFSEMLGQRLGLNSFFLERIFSIGRMLMGFWMCLVQSATSFSGLPLLTSPVVNSLWEPLEDLTTQSGLNYSQRHIAFTEIAFILVIAELTYFYLLVRKKNELQANIGPGGNILYKIFFVETQNTINEIRSVAKNNWQMKLIFLLVGISVAGIILSLFIISIR